MEEKHAFLSNDCDFSSVRPILMDLPYPPIRVKEKNQAYANLLSIDYCGAVSELSAITQYLNNENRLSCQMCSAAKTILGIAMAEMIHLQKLGELICLLGGSPDFTGKYRDGQKLWTPQNLKLSQELEKMLSDGIEAERLAVRQYEMHMKMIEDKAVNLVLHRIIQDERYHIMILQALQREILSNSKTPIRKVDSFEVIS